MSKNICNMCCGNTTSVNYAKQVDPHHQKYTTILSDSPQQGDFRRAPKKEPCPYQACLPAPRECPSIQSKPSKQHSSIIQIPCDPVKSCPKFVCEPCPPPIPTKVWLIKSSPVPQKVWLNRLLMLLLSFCLPVCNASPSGCPPGAKLMVCLPCPPPMFVSPGYKSEGTKPFPFAVPQKVEGESSKNKGKYLPPPERRQCSDSCIHKSDLRGDKPCTWHAGVPCVAHCFNTPLKRC